MKRLSRVMGTAAIVALGVSAMTSQPASAGNDAILGAVGGLMAGKLISDHQQKVREDSYRQGAEEQYIAQQQQQQYAAPQQPAAQSPEARLQKLKSLKDQGLISESDYNTQKAAIVSSL
ncbi:MAG: SHOCT domain-containing protein [Gammaproteobacteria bacterium]